MPGRSRQWATMFSRSGLSRSKCPRMQNLSGCRRAASTARTLTASPSELGGWITAQSTPAEAISASASSTEKVGIWRCCALILPFCQRWIWESTISMASSFAAQLTATRLYYGGSASHPQEEIVTKILTPPQPAPVMEIARELLPPGMELVVADPGKPEFYDAAVDAQYYLGSPRSGIGNEFFRAAPKLKLVQLTSAGYDRDDIEAARKAGVPVANNGGANSVAVAEHAVMLMLAVLKRLVYHHNNVVAGKWRPGDFASLRTYEIEGKRLGIVGLGNIGKKVARRVQGFDMDVRYFDILRLSEDQEDALGVRFTLFTELLRTSDVVTLHVPLNDVTRKMISTRELGMMKKTAILINTCRGPVVDEDALHQALTSGTIAAAGLDVMVEEPPKKNHPLFALPNVTLTPHSAGPTWDNYERAYRNGFDNIQRVESGQEPLWVLPELRNIDR